MVRGLPPAAAIPLPRTVDDHARPRRRRTRVQVRPEVAVERPKPPLIAVELVDPRGRRLALRRTCDHAERLFRTRRLHRPDFALGTGPAERRGSFDRRERRSARDDGQLSDEKCGEHLPSYAADVYRPPMKGPTVFDPGGESNP
jgi:hypothetical protein